MPNSTTNLTDAQISAAQAIVRAKFETNIVELMYLTEGRASKVFERDGEGYVNDNIGAMWVGFQMGHSAQSRAGQLGDSFEQWFSRNEKFIDPADLKAWLEDAWVGSRAASEAEYVLGELELRDIKLEAAIPADYLTDEANEKYAWMVTRNVPPFCLNQPNSDRRWFGPSAAEAVRKCRDMIPATPMNKVKT